MKFYNVCIKKIINLKFCKLKLRGVTNSKLFLRKSLMSSLGGLRLRRVNFSKASIKKIIDLQFWSFRIRVGGSRDVLPLRQPPLVGATCGAPLNIQMLNRKSFQNCFTFAF